MIDTYLNQTVQIKSRTGFDEFGKPTLAVASNIPARFVEKQKIMRDSKGNEYTVDAELWLLPTQSISLEDAIVYASKTYKAVKIDTERDLTGDANHKKALLIRTKE